MNMKKAAAKIHARWEYMPTPNAEARLAAAFDMLFGKFRPATDQEENLTEKAEELIMCHDEASGEQRIS